MHPVLEQGRCALRCLQLFDPSAKQKEIKLENMFTLEMKKTERSIYETQWSLMVCDTKLREERSELVRRIYLSCKVVENEMRILLRHFSNGFLVWNIMSCYLNRGDFGISKKAKLGVEKKKVLEKKNQFYKELLTTLSNPKYAVGPNGRWEIMRPSGTPRCSWTNITSVKSCERAVSMISEMTCK